MFADVRDDGLCNVPLDDAAAFADWKNKSSPHVSFKLEQHRGLSEGCLMDIQNDIANRKQKIQSK